MITAKKIITKGLQIASSPFLHQQKNTSHIMLMVVFACMPGLLALTYFFGYGSLIQALLAVITALLAEGAVLYLRKQRVINQLKDNSALLTGVLLGISLPPLAPWWIAVLGTLFAIVIAKQLYGGLGQNIFNPAMVGYVVLLISFPVQMTCWLPSIELQTAPINFTDSLRIIFTDHSYQDGTTQATPLDMLKTELLRHQPIRLTLQQPLFGGVLAGLGWQWVNVGFLVGGVLLWWRKIIQWHIPLSFLLALFCCAALSHLIAPESFASPLFHLFSGATMFGAFFIATDPVSASTTPLGRLIFGALIGVLLWLIRVYGGYPDGVAFAVLLANIAVPIIDHYSQPRVYGQ
ncbi:electron transport complex subunit RsxD [Candidatus Regiella insecticola]|uniref:Ion-translocating oxidoreductase complex subunit D n=1 Tax=Candidatus Regiella insecticola TaxID=138073 RepID=A0A6L2ZPW3_9ENTR|nr:electron transport complex subunit RsxD [Candidatus Regiella insecticola]GFN46917.1 ion-translocating oxidoreductase complex subunit D [Candidatus Regiella insecticola]